MMNLDPERDMVEIVFFGHSYCFRDAIILVTSIGPLDIITWWVLCIPRSCHRLPFFILAIHISPHPTEAALVFVGIVTILRRRIALLLLPLKTHLISAEFHSSLIAVSMGSPSTIHTFKYGSICR